MKLQGQAIVWNAGTGTVGPTVIVLNEVAGLVGGTAVSNVVGETVVILIAGTVVVAGTAILNAGAAILNAGAAILIAVRGGDILTPSVRSLFTGLSFSKSEQMQHNLGKN